MAGVDIEMAATSTGNTTVTEPRKRKPTGILRLTVEVPSSTRPPDPALPAPRWRTTEFLVYYVLVFIAVTLAIRSVTTLSDPLHSNYPHYSRRLSNGWIPGRKVDNSDHQHRVIRNNLPALTTLALAYLGVHKLFNIVLPHGRRINFILCFAAAMQLGLHGTSALKIAAILLANYAIGQSLLSSRALPLATWAFNLAVLFANEYYDGYKFSVLHPMLAPLDGIQGVYPRWHVTFNFTMLRLISFNMDGYWAARRVGLLDTGGELNEKQRPATSHELAEYSSFANYVAYILYPPLYIAGPILSFNDFLWQMKCPLHIAAREVASYAVRFVICLLTMEVILHYMYVVAIKDARAWAGATPAQLCMLGFWNLIIVWLKLLIPWRFFRLWALADGVDAPENMVRCMANNYSPSAFWRAWHRSFNLWNIRYIYAPLGGSRQQIPSMIVVFTFVALWHDLTFRLLAWGWLVSIFVLPEVAAKQLFPPAKFADVPWYRHLCAAGAVGNILMMMAANLIGFVLGVDGVQILLGWQFFVIACSVIFMVVQLMFEYREEEKRQGIYRRF